MSQYVFLDRDGTINFDEKGYISKPEDFHLFPFTIAALKLLTKIGYEIVIISNQSGIARGFFTFSDIEKIHKKMQNIFSENGLTIKHILIAPYHKEGKIFPYNIDHEDRKPGIGLYKKFSAKHIVNKNKSYVIGDSSKDIMFAKNAGLKSILVLSGHGKSHFDKALQTNIFPDFAVNNLLSAAKLIKKLELK
jgi:histidinol-phosphate phosphatase family protein